MDLNGVPQNRESTKYRLEYKGRTYPPKYLISIANKYVNGHELKPCEFSGGNESNEFLMNLGFEIKKYNAESRINNSTESTILIGTCCIESYKNINNVKRENLLLQLIDSLYDFDKVIAFKLKCLSKKLKDILKIISIFDDNTITFNSYSEPFETDTPVGKMQFQMMEMTVRFQKNFDN